MRGMITNIINKSIMEAATRKDREWGVRFNLKWGSRKVSMKRYTWGVLKNAAQEGCGCLKATFQAEEASK